MASLSLVMRTIFSILFIISIIWFVLAAAAAGGDENRKMLQHMEYTGSQIGSMMKSNPVPPSPRANENSHGNSHNHHK